MKKIISLCVFLASANWAVGQWQPVDSISAGTFQSIHFLNADTGFAYSEYAALRKTTDGTQSWDTAQVVFDSYIMDMEFVDANVGYAVGGAWFPFGRLYANSIMKTLDGGSTWDSVYGDYQNGVFSDVEVISANEFYAVGEMWACHSLDGGMTLDTMKVSQSANERYLKISFITAQHGYLLTQEYIQSLLSSYKLYETTNGGATWQAVYGDTTAFPGFSDFVFNSAGDGILVGEKGQVRVMKANSSWSIVSLPDTTLWIHSVAQADGEVYAIASIGVPASLNKLYTSSDFGLSWQEEQLNLAAGDYLTDMSFPGGGVGYFSTYRKIYKNADLISIKEQVGVAQFDVFPNPTTSLVNVKLATPENISVRVMNSTGSLISEKYFHSTDHFQVNLEDKEPGIYFLEIKVGDSTGTVKVMKM